MTTMATSQKNQPPAQAEIVAFEPALKRRRDREQFFWRYGEWVNPYRDGIDGLWVGPANAQIVPLVFKKDALGSITDLTERRGTVSR
jgi:hypothetical protein